MKKLLTIAMITLAVVAAKADLYLYWTVDISEDFASVAKYAAVEGSNGIVTSMGNLGYGLNMGDSRVNGTNFISSIDYYVALYDSAKNKIAISTESFTYDAILAHTYTREVGSEKPSDVTTLNIAGFTSTIPEPTSGLMLLLGLGALALKRKVA